MNYSTLKKTVALSVASVLAVGMVKAQTSTTTTSTTDSTMKTSETTNAKVFGGRGQYKTFSIGINGGVTAPVNATGGSNDYTNWKASYGYGASLRWQLAHSFGIQGDFNGGRLKGNNQDAVGGFRDDRRSFQTDFYSGTISGVVNVATIDYLRRKNAINFFVKAGAGLVWYNPTYVTANGNSYAFQNSDGSNHYVKSLVIPVGVGVKFRLSDAWALNLGYTENFTDDDWLDALQRGYPTKDKYSYGYAGLEWTIGSKSKPNLDWVNPVAMMYDELYDAALRQEVEALKGRVTNVENAVNDLKKDSDGDGVSDQFDKCPNTPAGTVVDGAGCPLKKDTVQVGGAATPAAYTNIQFDFDSSVLRTSSYPTLDAVSSDLRANTSKVVTLKGYASSEGTAAHNMRLSKDRANSVKTYLVNSGVEARRLKVKAYGETHPIADNSTEEGRVQNRRVEFQQ
ncbi:OmpA family protein [Mucilaginibacter sp. KACC 22063]|uniref:OmpA family protein n=1 Tax=Mucilaginibacter sp. KACC 22063 TaxID=3025666 RepID=UPI002365A565|nr:OmpA family protein [Mucilaginibacter sp. KACC 22063]WDF55201.1 OmpA family protein [Mucilaginibacter sp. KACC 22063]